MNKSKELRVLSIDSILQVVLQIILLSITSHYVDPASYGVFSLAFLIINLIKNFGLSGISISILRKKGEKHISTIVGVVVVFTLFITTLLLFFNIQLVGVLNSPKSSESLFFLSIFLLVSTLSLVLESYLVKVGRVLELAFANLVTFVVNLTSFLVLVDVFPSLSAYLWLTYSYVLSVVVRFIVFAFFIANKTHVFNPFRLKEVDEYKSTIKELVQVSSVSFVNSVALNVDSFLVSKYLGSGALGLYTRAYQINNYVSSIYSKVISKFGVKNYANCETKEEISYNYKIIIIATGCISVFFAMSVSLGSPLIVELLFGNDWGGLTAPLKILSLSLIFRLLYKAGDTYQLTFGYMRVSFCFQILLLSNVLIFVGFASQFSLEAVCYAILYAVGMQFFAMLIWSIFNGVIDLAFAFKFIVYLLFLNFIFYTVYFFFYDSIPLNGFSLSLFSLFLSQLIYFGVSYAIYKKAISWF
ncbi:oligosaccharide flippase family protein [Pseudoalteromonas sp. L23]|uniref:oligosaccharide flippase family protein n=1 Tax=unclassified Pseudoalteromonas TaxID=194690 RepID=UPI001EF07A68|nr:MULTISPECIES: oligosaccharide flippase family protein [unclassified Pseudoalteromonas]MCF7513922.1 oligosaccharide flippase family protein [Pseudoalteromonas sp. L7]MCF7525963.1 oligosaccharide flippase family protein [Pseudoalteromonas sp. L23]